MSDLIRVFSERSVFALFPYLLLPFFIFTGTFILYVYSPFKTMENALKSLIEEAAKATSQSALSVQKGVIPELLLGENAYKKFQKAVENREIHMLKFGSIVEYGQFLVVLSNVGGTERQFALNTCLRLFIKYHSFEQKHVAAAITRVMADTVECLVPEDEGETAEPKGVAEAAEEGVAGAAEAAAPVIAVENATSYAKRVLYYVRTITMAKIDLYLTHVGKVAPAAKRPRLESGGGNRPCFVHLKHGACHREQCSFAHPRPDSVEAYKDLIRTHKVNVADPEAIWKGFFAKKK